MHAALGISDASEPEAAGAAAVRAARSALAAPVDAVIVVATLQPPDAIRAVARGAADAAGSAAVAGAAASAIHAGGIERSGAPAVAALAVAGAPARAALAAEPAGRGAGAWARKLRPELGEVPAPGDLLLAFAELETWAPHAMAVAISEAAGAATPVACAPGGRASAVWAGHTVGRGSVAALRLALDRAPGVELVPTCRGLGVPRTVSRTQGHWVLSLDGRPALDAYRDAARGRLADDPARAADVLGVAVERPAASGRGPSQWLVRRVAGFDPRRGAFALAEPVRRGTRVRFALRDPATARRALAGAIERLQRAGPPAAVLHLACAAGGGRLHGVEGLEAGYLDRAFAPAPVLGLRAAWQAARVAGRPEVLTFADVLVAMPR